MILIGFLKLFHEKEKLNCKTYSSFVDIQKTPLIPLKYYILVKVLDKFYRFCTFFSRETNRILKFALVSKLLSKNHPLKISKQNFRKVAIFWKLYIELILIVDRKLVCILSNYCKNFKFLALSCTEI